MIKLHYICYVNIVQINAVSKKELKNHHFLYQDNLRNY